MSNSSQYSQDFDPNNDQLDQKTNNNLETNRTDLNDKSKDDQTIQLHQQQNSSQSRTNSLTNGQVIVHSQSASLINNLINSNTESTLCHSVTADNLNEQSPQSLPPQYCDVPGIVPIAAGTSSGPPPSYEEVVNPNVSPPSYHSLFGQIQGARKNAKTLPDLIRKLIIILLGTIGLALLLSFTVLIPVTMILVGASNLDNCRAEKNIPLFLLVGGIAWLTKNLSNFFSQCSSRRTNRSTTNSSSANNNNNNSSTNSSSNPCASRYSENACAAESNTCASSSTNCGNNNSNSTNRSSRCVINLEAEAEIQQQAKSRRRDFLINCFITAWFLTGCIMVYRIYPPNYSDTFSPNYCNRTVYIYAFWLLTSTFIIFALFIGCICCLSLTAIFQSNSEIRI